MSYHLTARNGCTCGPGVSITTSLPFPWWICELTICRIVEEEIETAIESRNEALQTIRELGPPDLVHLIKQSKSGGRQVWILVGWRDLVQRLICATRLGSIIMSQV